VRLLLAGFLIFITGWGLATFVRQMMNLALTPDLAWLLRTGHHIIQTHRLPAHDLYSWTYPKQAWVVYQWLFEVIISAAHRVLGLAGLTRAFIILVLVIYFWGPAMTRRGRRVPVVWSIPLAALALAMISIDMELRPMILTSLFLWLQFELIEALREGRRSLSGTLLALIPIYILWGNCHLGVSLGLISIILFLMGDQLERRGWLRLYPVCWPGDVPTGVPLGFPVYLLILVTAFAVSLINPYGLGIYTYLASLSLRTTLNNGIQELGSPNFHHNLVLLLMGFGVLFAALLPRMRRVFAAHEVLHLAGFTLASLFSLRMLVWAGSFYVLILPMALHRYSKTVRQPLLPFPAVEQFFERRRVLVFVVLIAGGVGLSVAAPHLWPLRFVDCQNLKPAIAAYLKARQPGDRLFNSGTAGSCILLQSKNVPVFIDTRFDFYPDTLFSGAKRALELEPGWQDFLRYWHVNTFIVPMDWPLSSLLLTSPDYQVLYKDKHAVVARRTTLTIFQQIPELSRGDNRQPSELPQAK
jgi:hypothetical protein